MKCWITLSNASGSLSKYGVNFPSLYQLFNSENCASGQHNGSEASMLPKLASSKIYLQNHCGIKFEAIEIKFKARHVAAETFHELYS
eukprot:SAG31_NODE_1563_length_7869_cov_6.990734_4_plen_87_part_00